MKEKDVVIKLIKSTIGYGPKIRNTVKALGLRKVNHTKVHKLTPQIEGMIKKVEFLLEVKELNKKEARANG